MASSNPGAQDMITEAAHKMSAAASIAGSIVHERKRLQHALTHESLTHTLPTKSRHA